ncbi:type I-E CRISPR-associated protein Cse1/CasA [Oerskovia enterophila]|uniref:type I-E CRISPR-associated protein Cse1/CasA n=1 Tax=Oerskovia enterophila TaxID=43678 RepID=UPI003396619C
MTTTEGPLVGPWFNLVDEPWAAVLDTEGTYVEVSLLDVFRRADRISRLVGETPTQAFANLRLLLAVLHRAVDGPADHKHWSRIRDDWDGTVQAVEAYLAGQRERFWLAHPNQPFMQVPDLQTSKGETFGLDRIICDGLGSTAYLTTRLGAANEAISWAEAARWLVHAHAFDVSGIHTGAVGDPRVSGGKGFGIGTGWAGQFGGLQLVGETLRETLLLNLVAPAAVGLLGGPDAALPDVPVWERDPLTAAPEGWETGTYPCKEKPYRQPTGPVDLYTWPTRRIRLVGDGERVTAVINAQGDRATPHNRHDVEPLTAWRHSEPQSKAFGREVYMPLRHDPQRSLWRGLGALLPNAEMVGQAGKPARRLQPAVLTWAARLRRAELIGDQLVAVRAIGIEYGSNDSIYGELIDDELTLPVALLADPTGTLPAFAVEAASAAGRAVYALGLLAKNLALAAGGSTETDGPHDRAAEQGYAALDGPFRDWVATLRGGIDATEREADWHRTADQELNRIARSLLREAGPAALVGRVAGGRFIDAGIAERWFHRKLREVLPRAHDARDMHDTSDRPVAESEEVA